MTYTEVLSAKVAPEIAELFRQQALDAGVNPGELLRQRINSWVLEPPKPEAVGPTAAATSQTENGLLQRLYLLFVNTQLLQLTGHLTIQEFEQMLRDLDPALELLTQERS